MGAEPRGGPVNNLSQTSVKFSCRLLDSAALLQNIGIAGLPVLYLYDVWQDQARREGLVIDREPRNFVCSVAANYSLHGPFFVQNVRIGH